MNKVFLTGNLTKDCETKRTQSDHLYTFGTIAVQSSRKDKDGNYLTDFIEFIAWDRQAEYIAKYLGKGYRVEFVGTVSQDVREDNNGKKIYSYMFTCETISGFKVAPKEEKQQSNYNPYTPPVNMRSDFPEVAVSDDDLPF